MSKSKGLGNQRLLAQTNPGSSAAHHCVRARNGLLAQSSFVSCVGNIPLAITETALQEMRSKCHCCVCLTWQRLASGHCPFFCEKRDIRLPDVLRTCLERWQLIKSGADQCLNQKDCRPASHIGLFAPRNFRPDYNNKEPNLAPKQAVTGKIILQPKLS